MTDEQNRIIREIEKLQLAVEKRFIDQYPVLFADLYRDVLEVTSNIRFSGSADTRAAQLLELMRVKKRIAAIISDNPNYVKAVKEVTDSFVEVRNLTDDYFRTVIDGYKPKQDLYTAILKANVEATKDALLGAGISDEFAKPITDTIRATLLKKSNKEPLNVALQRMIEGYGKEKPLLEAALKRNVSDSVMIFERNYIETISADLNISYFIYSGTAIETSRPFCKARVGKIFKKSEVESWARLDWAGKIAGTTKETIFSFAGGWQCRHSLYPATKAQYTIQQKKKD
jgi:hypothetical protein